jgi:YD repeat-containing protein
VTDANSRHRDTYYDTLGRVTRVENEMDQPVDYAYDQFGRLTQATDEGTSGVARKLIVRRARRC